MIPQVVMPIHPGPQDPMTEAKVRATDADIARKDRVAESDIQRKDAAAQQAAYQAEDEATNALAAQLLEQAGLTGQDESAVAIQGRNAGSYGAPAMATPPPMPAPVQPMGLGAL
jgi:hypothetical protein